ncbi:twitching motility protein [Desulfurobacterium thermolithotrophum DSM 11699]|uniref:Twitching motility protein n=1 Tax=Desulfurobacterium thermolithotrophum (strain DSM 11699 / BSA) TaxID=868864 RepID=F0S217_DESTD|nr:type IV pilus twitching motility protein PilT [Desulfurobacterium thermolithotrophum]ADY74098.1 twitching motility protein [Desulfurobacterium thermolithotrophum DSM 11699]
MTVELNSLLTKAFKLGASDIHLRVKLPPVFRINGKLIRTELPPITLDDINLYVKKILPVDKLKELPYIKNLDTAYSIPGVCRFRVNLFRQRGTFAIVMRIIPSKVPEVEELNLPSVIKEIALYQRGLVLVTGTTGSGKSTTLAAMLNELNNKDSRVVVTIEDPIEYLHKDKKCIFYQREIGDDAENFFTALRAALREDPDVILVGEMRDSETVRTALDAAETGHMVFSTLHTLDAKETINRIISFFPPHHQQAIRYQLASVLRATISQRLIPRADRKGRVPAVEIMIVTGAIRERIINPELTEEIPEFIEKGKEVYGSQTFDQSLYDLWKKGFITKEDALKYATKPDDLKLKMEGIFSSGFDI